MSEQAVALNRGGPTDKTLRIDAWWIEPAITVGMLSTFIIYTTWAALVNDHYYVAPYLSPESGRRGMRVGVANAEAGSEEGGPADGAEDDVAVEHRQHPGQIGRPAIDLRSGVGPIIRVHPEFLCRRGHELRQPVSPLG